MGTVPEALQVVFLAWGSGFSKTVFPNFVTLVLGAMLTTGRRTVSHILLTIGELAVAHPSTYHRILSHRRWSMWHLARPIAAYILDTLIPDEIICLAGDDTVTEHTGKKVHGKGRHRDAKRSTNSFMAHRPSASVIRSLDPVRQITGSCWRSS